MHVAALRNVIRWDRQVWVGGILNRDGLRRGCVVAALVDCRERPCHHVAVVAREHGVGHFHDGVQTAVVRRSGSIEWVHVAALCCVIRWDGQHRDGCVNHRDGLSHRRVVVTIVCCGERALDLVRAWAIAWHNLLLQTNEDFTVTVVGGRSVVVDDGLTALNGVIRWDGQFWVGCVNQSQELLEHGLVAALIHCSVHAHVHACGLNAST